MFVCFIIIFFWREALSLFKIILEKFEPYYSVIRKQQVHLKDILIGILTPESPLLNYLIPETHKDLKRVTRIYRF